MKILYHKNWNFLMNAHRKGKLAHAFLFCGPQDTGKFEFAVEIAREIGGFSKDVSKLADGQDPDMFIVQPEVEKRKGSFKIKKISAGQLRPILEKTSYFPYQAKQKILIIKMADMMTNSAANSILKLIEEPVADLKIILTATSDESVIPTIKSRCQVLRFGLLGKEQIKEHLLRICKTKYPGKTFSEKSISEAEELSGGRAKQAEQFLMDKQLRQEMKNKIENFRMALRGGIYSGLKLSEKESGNRTQLIYSVDQWIIYLSNFLKKIISENSERKIQRKILFMLKELVETEKRLKNTNASERLMLDNFFVKINW